MAMRRLAGTWRRLLGERLSSTYRPPQESNNEPSVDFGYESVPYSKKTELVKNVFERVATRYDLMNDVMSGGVHRLWKDAFVEILSPVDGIELLDVAGGTGDIAFRVINYLDNARQSKFRGENRKKSRVTVSDINEAMLGVGRERGELESNLDAVYRANVQLDFLQANAESLPIPDESYSAYTVAFGIRNVTNREKALAEAYRVLKRGGRFMCLEFSKVENPALRWAYDQYSFQVIPCLGQVFAGDWASYKYLVESIRMFPDQEKFAGMLRNAGFKRVTYRNLSFGIVAVHSGFKF